MTRVIVRRDPLTVISDDHRRIRRLEAEPSTGGSGADCPDCVLDPFTVNPGDIFVPIEFRGCVDIGGATGEFGQACGTGNVFLISGVPIGYCSGFGLGTLLKLQVNIDLTLGSGSGLTNIQNVIVYAGVGPLSQVFVMGWPVAGLPGASTGHFSSGWVDVDADLCGGGSCAPLFMAASFSSHSSFTGGCAGDGVVAARWVVVTDDNQFRGALDDLPQGQAFGDTIHFNSNTHQFVIGPRSVPSRAISSFMGGR